MSEQTPEPDASAPQLPETGHDEQTPDPGASDDSSALGISDEQLPEDLQPGEDNPLANPLPDGESADLGLDSGEPDGDQRDDRGDDDQRDQPE